LSLHILCATLFGAPHGTTAAAAAGIPT